MCDFCGLQKPCRCDPERLIKNLEAENKRLLELLEEAQEEIQNCYGRDIELTERITEVLEGRRE